MEPMDLDNPHTPDTPRTHHGNGDVSDMEIDPNSPSPPRPHPHHSVMSKSTPIVDSESSGQRINTYAADCGKSVPLNLLGFGRLLQSVCGDRIPLSPPRQPQREAEFVDNTERICQSAPPLRSPFLKESQDGPQKPRSKLKPKKGYGIPRDNFDGDEDGILFSHYPLTTGREERNESTRLRKRDVGSDGNTLNKMSATCPTPQIEPSHRVLSPRCLDKPDKTGLKSQSQTPSNQRQGSFNMGGGFGIVIRLSIFLLASIGFLAFIKLIVVPKSSCSRSFFQYQMLEDNLARDLFGQHIASRLISTHLQKYFTVRHFGSGTERQPSKGQHEQEHQEYSSSNRLCQPLVLSFHGWTGVGKNFASRIISLSFSQAAVVHPLIIPLAFPHTDHGESYANQLSTWMSSNALPCRVNLFLLDEMDKACPAVQEALLQSLKSLTSSCVARDWPVIVILISNTHGAAINQRLLDHYQTTLPSPWSRNDLTPQDFHSIFSPTIKSPRTTSIDSSNITQEKHWYSGLNEAGFIDVFVPFLPLEKSQVVECIKRDLIAKHVSTDKHIVSAVIKELSFSVLNSDLELSTTGCKRVSDKVDYVVYNQID